MRITFFTHYFPPEVNAPARRTFEHARLWVKWGCQVDVITCIPSHPAGRPFPGYKVRPYMFEMMDGIRVHRVWTYLAPNSGVVKRSLNYLSYAPSAKACAVALGAPDVIVATSPQFFCALAGFGAAKIMRVPWVFEVRDLWPESLEAVGVTGYRLLGPHLSQLANYLYRNADMVVCVTRSFIRQIEDKGVEPSRLAFIPNGVELEAIERADPIRGRALAGVGDGKFLVSYVGTLGMAHDLEVVLKAAKLLEGERVTFALVGDGADRQRLIDLQNRMGLERSVKILGLVEHSKALDILAGSDACLVHLKPHPLFETVIPSKMLEAMAAGKPVLLGVKGEARDILREAGAGIAFEPADAEALASAVKTLAANPAKTQSMGNLGKVFVRKGWTREALARSYLEVLREVSAE